MKFKELYLDTTYVMPFLFLDIDVKGFSRDKYKEIMKSVDRIHISEVSLIEAKAKSLKLDFFDRIILAQSASVGFFLTEDSKLLNLKDIGIKIINWKNLIKEMKIS